MQNLVFTRIDDRLIHGQVCAAWLKTYSNIQHILVIDDKTSQDPFMQEMFKLLIPSHISIEIRSVAEATEILKAGLPKPTMIIVKVPDTIKDANGKTYKVTAVASKSFYKNKKVKTVTVGKNTTTIGTSAFKQATKLTTVTLNGKVTSIGKEAFSGSSKLSKITLNGNALKSVGKNAFKVVRKTARLLFRQRTRSNMKRL